MMPRISAITRNAKSKRKDPHEARILMFVGGGRRGGLSWTTARRHDLVIIADVPTEIDHWRTRFCRFPNILYIPLGEGKTAAALFEYAGPHLHDAVDELAPMNAEDGMGSLPGLAHQAALEMVNSVEFDRILQFIVDCVVMATNGSPSRVRGRTGFSVSGGTGAGASVILTRAIIKALSSLQIPILWGYEVIGAVGFTSLAHRAPINAASAQWRLLRDLLLYPLPNAVWPVESARFLEIPPFGQDDNARSHFVALDEQSWHAPAIQQHLMITEPNAAMDGKYGNISSWQLDHSEELSPRTEVAPTVAMFMRQRVTEALSNSLPLLSRVSEIIMSQRTAILSRDSIKDILDRSGDVDEAIRDICLPGFEHSVHFSAIIDVVHEFKLDQIAFDFAMIPKTLSEFTNSVQILSSIEVTLNSELGLSVEELESISDDQNQLSAKLADQLERYFSGRRPYFTSSPKYAKKISGLAVSLRELSDQLEKQSAQVKSLRRAVEAVANELGVLREHATTLIDTLGNWCPRGTAVRDSEPLITVRSPDNVFPELWMLNIRTEDEQLEILAQWTEAITLHGLAKIVGASAPRFEVIAEKITGDCFTVEGPPLGARKQRRHVSEMVVLPPLQSEYRDILIEQIRKLNPHRLVATADSASAGVTVVRYTVFSVGALTELFPGRLRADLRRAFHHKSRHLFFPDGFESLAEDLQSFEKPRPEKSEEGSES